MIDFVAMRPHYLDHLAPIWLALPERYRGGFRVADGMEELARWYGIDIEERPPGRVLVSASLRELANPANSRKLVLTEHGIGQTYHDPHGAYAGGPGRAHIDVFLCPNDFVARANRMRYPRADVAVVGTPKMDRYFGMQLRGVSSIPAVSFHWNCDLYPETASGWRYFSAAVAQLIQRENVIAHEHPNSKGEHESWYRQHGAFYAAHFHTVMTKAGLYICDNSSTIYEFAATDRPVVVLNPAHYRRSAAHGLRFWEFADVGVQCDYPDQLEWSIEQARADTAEQVERRHDITEQLYPVRDGTSARRSADVLVSIL